MVEWIPGKTTGEMGLDNMLATNNKTRGTEQTLPHTISRGSLTTYRRRTSGLSSNYGGTSGRFSYLSREIREVEGTGL